MSKHQSRTVLDREADARFWAQTHYKVGQKLDPSDAVDRTMAPVWVDVRHKVQLEDDAGRLVLTYNHPTVERALGDAELAQQAAGAHADAAAVAPDDATAGGHADAAAEAATRGAIAASTAAAHQPPTVSPIVVDAAAALAALALGIPKPVPLTDVLPATHPAISSPAAQPATAPAPAPAPPPESAPTSTPAVPRTPGEHLAAVAAVVAPIVAAHVHDEDAPRARSMSVVPPAEIAVLRATAATIARQTTGRHVGAVGAPDGTWSGPVFSTAEEADIWFHHMVESPGLFRYLAVFDRGDGDAADAGLTATSEMFGSARAFEPPPVRPPAGASRAGTIAVVAGVAAVTGVLAIITSRRR